MFKKVLIANRGEIALRVIRACREMGIPNAAVYSNADRQSLHVLLADEAYFVGPPPSRESYLNVENLMKAIKKSGADAVHPGYGFLSENADFARLLKENGITFVGPSPESIELMGDKVQARKTMMDAGVPTVPGSKGAVTDLEELTRVVNEIGYPVIIKAAAGGGGKGMRIVKRPEDLELSYNAAKSEAMNYFSNDVVYVERFIQNPKHIEIQVFGDNHGNAVHLFERECSIQRRHQKLIEESPSIAVPEEVRRRMGEVAVTATKAIGYSGAGTFEFIFDNETKEFFFMEMNTRLQVEHPVTEMVTGYDLVKEQLNVAAGKKLSFKQEDITQNGHAIEVRVCAEDPETYLPSPGKIERCRHPQGPFIRVDSYAYPQYEVPIYYDPMVAKLIAWGKTRQDAIDRLQRALAEFTLSGIKTNIVLLRSILEQEKFIDGTYTTQFLEKDFKNRRDLFHFVDDRAFLIAAAIEAHNDLKNRSVEKMTDKSRWKDFGRIGALR